MCGICGFSGPTDESTLHRMLKCLEHRGPDDDGIYIDENMSLGMTRLAVIDPKSGAQPIANEDGTVWVVFNGEIYNYLELRKNLKEKGHSFKTNSDTEVIVHAYEEFGLLAPHYFNGMFSVAIWDVRKKSLIVFRDRFGVKPLFFSCSFTTFVFGSEIKALLQHKAVSKDINFEALSHYFSLRNIPAPFTIYRDIHSLPPGKLLQWNSQGIQISKWYEIKMETGYETEESDIADQIDSLIKDSVRLRMRSDVNIGAYLSGGIDSSLIVAYMAQFSQLPIKTFTLGYDDSPEFKQDMYFARLVANKFSTQHNEFYISWKNLADDIFQIVSHLDQPFAGVISSFWLSQFMKKSVTVALSGDGADDLFASYGHHRLVWPMAVAKSAELSGTIINPDDLGFFKDKLEFVANFLKYSPWEWRLSYAAFMEQEKKHLFSEKGKTLFSNFSTSEWLKKIYLETAPDVDELNKMLYLDISTLLPNEILYFNDMLSMMSSLEVRTPYLDYRIVELAAKIPGKLKIKGQDLKYILRKVASRYLPPEILTRPKEGFVLPKNAWLRQGLKPTLLETLSEKHLELHGYFNKSYVDSTVDEFLKGEERLTFKVWTLFVFQLWYEMNNK